ncbi:endonuclease/exonuclease/phosphatase family protein [Actinomadura harenae]|uniref:Endonuclease/exonuclease/phosphatase family protein n=1 Tax=Actinomadura harenae TaxID=2483351 RepID=A0A3M2LSL9_9ACTN|nr:hypothetical protein [Actinomadura harenae]RMI39860.1 hypothetical protein EBO15_28235 [Actinomadura harenae]
MTHVKIGAFNHENGGRDIGDWGRLIDQAEMIASLELDVLFSTEGKGWLDNGREALWLAARRLGMHPSVARAPRHDCNLVIWTRSDTVRVRRERHQEHHPWWHALAYVEADVAGVEEPVALVGCHLSPFDPANRVAEARALTEFARRLAVMGGDFNDEGFGDWAADLSALSPVQRLHRDVPGELSAAGVLAEAGFIDLATEVFPDPADRRPTAGHDSAAQRCDRLYLSPPAREWFRPTGYQVTQPVPNLSDHSLITTVLEVIR